MSLPEEDTLKQELLEALLGLSFHGFAACLRLLLESVGYSDVELMGRTHFRGRSRDGGLDLQGLARTGVTHARIIVQAKQYAPKRPVQKRFVDELRGVMLRTGAAQGLLITTSTFPTLARITAARERIAPIRLISGEELVSLMIRTKLGVIPQTGKDGQQRRRRSLAIDESFFADLNERYPHSKKRTWKTNQRQNGKPGQETVANEAGYQANHNQAQYCCCPSEDCGSSSSGQEGGSILWRTHVLAGMAMSLWLIDIFSSGSGGSGVTPDNLAPLALAASFGALLPDLDAEGSKIASLRAWGIQPFAPVSSAIYRAWGHRGPLHSLLGLAIMGGGAALLIPWWGEMISSSLLLGYASHLVLDACTKSGIPLLYPRKKRYHLLPARLRLTTGSLAEEALFPCFAILLLLLLVKELRLVDVSAASESTNVSTTTAAPAAAAPVKTAKAASTNG